ncbi:unnamed protein product, partial [Ectocarpus sp. 12 AP-2014]
NPGGKVVFFLCIGLKYGERASVKTACLPPLKQHNSRATRPRWLDYTTRVYVLKNKKKRRKICRQLIHAGRDPSVLSSLPAKLHSTSCFPQNRIDEEISHSSNKQQPRQGRFWLRNNEKVRVDALFIVVRSNAGCSCRERRRIFHREERPMIDLRPFLREAHVSRFIDG